MKLQNIINFNKPQIKVEAHVKSGPVNPRMLLLQDLSEDDVAGQIKQIISKVVEKCAEGKTNIKLIDKNPVAFNIIPESGKDFYRFVVSLPPGDIQKGLIIAIENFEV